MKDVSIGGSSLEDLKKLIDAFPDGAKPTKTPPVLTGPVLRSTNEYKGFTIREWVTVRGNKPIFTTAYEIDE